MIRSSVLHRIFSVDDQDRNEPLVARHLARIYAKTAS